MIPINTLFAKLDAIAEHCDHKGDSDPIMGLLISTNRSQQVPGICTNPRCSEIRQVSRSEAGGRCPVCCTDSICSAVEMGKVLLE